jgi:membrane protease subunit (stomatin/prohibitin family)
MLTHWALPIDEAEALRLAAEAGAAAAPSGAVVGNGAVLGEHLESAQSQQQQQQQQQHQLPATVARPSYLSPYCFSNAPLMATDAL